MRNILHDLRYAVRVLTQSPGFTTLAVLTLALGIGSTTAIFSMVYGVLFRPLAVPEARQVVEVVRTERDELSDDAFTYPQFRFLQEHSSWPAAFAAFTHVGFNLSTGQETQRVSALHVSRDYFSVLGACPIFGRDFSPEEDRDPGARVLILSESLWKQQFASDRAIVGRSILLNGTPYQVIGIMPGSQANVQLDFVPPAFGGLQRVDLWTTLAPVAASIGSGTNLQVVARLKPQLTLPQASAQLATLDDSFRKEQLDQQDQHQSLGLTSVQQVIAANVSPYLWILLAAVGFLLLIACANISNLLLARGATRAKEVAIRSALGASRLALIRQFLVESLALAIAGGIAGFFVAQLTTALLLRFATSELPRLSEIHVDTWALLFALLIAAFSGIIAGVVPALRTSRTDIQSTLKENAAQSSGGFSRSRFRSVLVVSEIALSLILLVGASLLVETFLNLWRVNPGFQSDHVLSAEIWLTGSRLRSSAELATFYDNLTARVKALPGVEEVAAVSSGQPLERGGNLGVFVNDAPFESMDFRVVTPQYFDTLRVNILRGRDFSAADSAQAEPVVIVNEAFVRGLKGRDPFTTTVRVGDHDTPRRIVGIAPDIRSFVGFPADSTVFIPAAQTGFDLILGYDVWFPTHVLVRTAGNPRLFTHSLETAIRETDSSIPVGRIVPMDDVLARSLSTQRFMMLVVAVFAVLATVLAVIGIYGVISFSVSQRTQELGIRMALGANASDLITMILGQGARLAVIGALLGVTGTLALHNALRSVLFGVQATDWATILGAGLCLLAVALFACYVPARRATKVDPNVALRYE
jgi:putative ABC transport system permease protein